MPVNPFSPGTSYADQLIFGRGGQLAIVGQVVNQIENSYPQSPICFIGPSGLGKTTILKYIARKLTDKHWLCGYSEASSNVGSAIFDVLADAGRLAPRKSMAGRALSRIKGFNVTAGPISLGLDIESVESGSAYNRLVEIFQAISDSAKFGLVGAALLMDEIQVLPQEHIEILFRALSVLDESPIVLFMAALPNIEDKFSPGSRSDQHYHLSWLAPLDARDATALLDESATLADGEFDSAASAILVEFSEGHPLTLQMLGADAWELGSSPIKSGDRVVVREDHAREAIVRVRQQLKRTSYRPVWKSCTPRQRALLQALAQTSGAVTEQELLDSMGAKGAKADALTDDLIDLIGRGVLYDYDDFLTWVVPGFRDFAVSKT
jgi:hypothetical protein